jgi:hypothetical protein
MKLKRHEKKYYILKLHGQLKAKSISKVIGCSREYVYIVWKKCGLKIIK